MSFALKLINQEGGEIRFIKSKENGKPCWCYLRIEPAKWQAYKQALRQKFMNIRDYGEVLKTGWGEHPPAGVITYIHEEFGFETPKRDSN